MTENDIRNAEILVNQLHVRSRASAVSGALAIAEGPTRKIEDDGELIVRGKRN